MLELSPLPPMQHVVCYDLAGTTKPKSRERADLRLAIAHISTVDINSRALSRVRLEKMSGNNRNVRILAPVEMSGVGTLSLLSLERLSPWMIFGWTPTLAAAILGRAVGRIGLRRRATRAPDGRLYASRLGSLTRSRAFFRPTGVGRQCAKRIRDVTILKIVDTKSDRQTPIEAFLHHHPPATLTRIDRRQQLIQTIAETNRVVRR
jgi:hypothetical protein